MNQLLFFLDGIAVTVYGSMLAASFCQGPWERRNKGIFGLFVLGILLVQGLVCYVWGTDVLPLVYPLVTHIPLTVLLCLLTGKGLWPVCCVTTAYLCCQLRRWIALFITALAGGAEQMQTVSQLVITLPMFLLLLRLAAPAMRKLQDYPWGVLLRFGLIPAFYYGFDYLTAVYTDLLTRGGPVVVEFMPFVCCGAYLAFLLYHDQQEQRAHQLRQKQDVLRLQIRQSVRQIHALRESQEQARQYRHDLRHHLQYIAACIENGQGEHAREYISGICRQIEAHKVNTYCDNEAMNLILSSFVSRAEKCGITMRIQGQAGARSKLSDSDLCVLLSNALENAIHACQAPELPSGQVIGVTFYEKGDKFFLQVINPCRKGVAFENGIPVSDRPGHGIGVQSICDIVQRYQGVYAFCEQDGQFILRLSV